MPVVEGLRRARAASGLSLSDVAARSGIALSNLSTIEHARREPTAATIDRLASALGVTLVPVATGGKMTVAEAATLLRTAVVGGDSRLAYRIVVQVSDDLASASPFARALLAAESPALIDAPWDGFLAAVVEWRLAEVRLPAPEWALASAGVPSQPWQPPGSVLPARPDHVAEPFARRGILVEVDELVSA